ncbi:MAG: hypothetical protein HRT44_11365, partial [Bdellovibrionales bacterium]|nr:hypothetical protein [Bdellovibrionales bacterium]NQZ19840.1 hypothetical protein [Bdellovibrionales bacterium]
MLKSKLSLALAGIIVIYSLSSEAKTCTEAFEYTFEQQMIQEFMQFMEPKSSFGASVFAREMANGTPQYIDGTFPAAVVTFRSYSVGGRRAFEVVEIKERKDNKQDMELTVDLIVHAMIKAAQRYHRTHPEVRGVQIILPWRGIGVTAQQRALGFSYNGGRFIFLDLSPGDILAST